MTFLYSTLNLLLFLGLGAVNWHRAKDAGRVDWGALFVKTSWEGAAAILLGLYYPPALIGLSTMWLMADRARNPYLIAIISAVLASLLGLASKQALEILIVVGALSMHPISRVFSHHFNARLAQLCPQAPAPETA